MGLPKKISFLHPLVHTEWKGIYKHLVQTRPSTNVDDTSIKSQYKERFLKLSSESLFCAPIFLQTSYREMAGDK